MARVKMPDGSIQEVTDYIRLRKINATDSVIEMKDGTVLPYVTANVQTEEPTENIPEKPSKNGRDDFLEWFGSSHEEALDKTHTWLSTRDNND